ncbi:MAG: FAD-dependent oxidoreductase [Deltaproteobacteria bacterium]|nr:FAD-dependent oxidoreductase [Deltaproteobacteria bacterium]MBW2120413.1 FAD-dependent oxidoreductase [Deltaproteobacteria bacterium]
MKSSGAGHVAVFLDHCGGALSDLLDEEMVRYASGLPQVVSCNVEEDLSRPGGLARLASRLKQAKADRVVIAGRSPRWYERSFRSLAVSGGLNPYMFLVVNLQDQVAGWIPDVARARQKTRGLLAKTVKEALLLRPIRREEIEIPNRAVVVGGGAVGLCAASALADAGIEVTLLTEAEEIGEEGDVLPYLWDEPFEMGSWLGERVEEVKGHPKIDVKTSVEIRGFEGRLGDYHIEIEDPSGRREIVEGSAVILATGCDSVPNREGIFGHRRFISLRAMESMLERGGETLADEKGRPVRTVVFLLDLVNEASKIDSASAMKNAILLKKDHDCAVYVICRNVKVCLDGMESQYRSARDMGVVFIKYDDPPRLSLVDSQVNVEVKEVSTRMRGDQYSLSILTDLVVSGERFVPSWQTKRLAGMFGIPSTREGYLMDDNPQFCLTGANRRGLFLAGGRGFPLPLDEALKEAEAAAAQVARLVSSGTYAYDLAVAVVNPAKCALCLTCLRVCPHRAVVVEKYAAGNVYTTERGEEGGKSEAARVLAVQCYGCGICVASCPTRAIALNHLTDQELSLQVREWS